MTTFTIGCDPEVFLVDRETKKPISAYGLLPGTKEKPHKTKGGAVQVDGMAAEFNTDPVPLGNFLQFNANIIKQIRKIKEMVGEDVSLSIVPVLEFGKEFLDTQPAEAKELGCDPDYSAYTLQPNPRPDGENSTFRTGAGHIHVGWGADIPTNNEEHIKICAEFVKMLDKTVGLYMVLLDPDRQRATLYGKAGAMRPKSYGVEYRTPSNVWIKSHKTRQVVHSLCCLATQLHSSAAFVCPPSLENAQKIINDGNQEEAARGILGLRFYLEPNIFDLILETTDIKI